MLNRFGEMEKYDDRVLEAFTKRGYTLRSGSGLRKDSEQVPDNQFQVALSRLVAKNLVVQTTGKDGKPRFFLTPEGRRRLAELSTQ